MWVVGMVMTLVGVGGVAGSCLCLRGQVVAPVIAARVPGNNRRNHLPREGVGPYGLGVAVVLLLAGSGLVLPAGLACQPWFPTRGLS